MFVDGAFLEKEEEKIKAKEPPFQKLFCIDENYLQFNYGRIHIKTMLIS